VVNRMIVTHSANITNVIQPQSVTVIKVIVKVSANVSKVINPHSATVSKLMELLVLLVR